MKNKAHQKINILHVIDKFSMDPKTMHGATRLLSYMALLNKKERYTITICSLKYPDDASKQLEQQGVQIVYLHKSKYDPCSLVALARTVKREKTDLLHLHGYGSWSFGRLIKSITGIPVIVHCHAVDPHYPRIQKVCDYLLAGLTDRAIAVSESARIFLIKEGRIPPGKIVVMHNCVPAEYFRWTSPRENERGKKKLGLAHNVRIIGTITRLYEQKGNRYLLLAAAQVLKLFHDVVFVIVGDGPLRGELEKLSAELGIERNVVFTGFRNDVREALGTFDIAVQASLWEGTPLTLLEALAMGKAVVATNVDGMGEILEEGKNALLVNPGDPNGLAAKIIYLLDHADERARLGLNAYEKSQRHSVDAYLTKLETVYDGVADRVVRSGG